MSENLQLGYDNVGGDEDNNKQKSVNEIQHSESKSLKLIFLKPVHDLVYTGVPIGGGASPEIALIDILKGSVVKSGPEASANVGFFVLNKSFNKDDKEDWTSEEFEGSILPGRHGKASLLGKSTHIFLNEGLGSLKDISFSHTRDPLPKINVRLGARVVDSSGRIRIREAISNPFVVKDRRSRTKKDYPISLNDKVWRLENIGRDGPSHKKLCKEKIETIDDFLAKYKAEPGRLHDILGETMSPKKLESAINHAKQCEDNMKKPLSFALISQQDTDVVLENVEEDGLEAKHDATKMVSGTYKDDASDMIVAACMNSDEDGVVDDHSSNPCLVANSYGTESFDSLDDVFSPPFNMLHPASRIGAFLEDEHQWHLLDTNHIISTENEPQQSLNPFDAFECRVFNPSADLCSERDRFLVCDVPIGRVHIRWKVLRSILRWFSIRRIVARKLEALQQYQQEELFCPDDLNATNARSALQVG